MEVLCADAAAVIEDPEGLGAGAGDLDGAAGDVRLRLDAVPALCGIEIVPEKALFHRGGKALEPLDGEGEGHLQKRGHHVAFQVYGDPENRHIAVLEGKRIDLGGVIQRVPAARRPGIEAAQMDGVQPREGFRQRV